MNQRHPDHAIAPMFYERWSHLSYTDDEISDAQLFRLFEAARWAPSSSNSQPWRFLYAKRSDRHFAAFHGLLAEGNRTWAAKAAALLFVLSAKTQDYKGTPQSLVNHSFDTGAAWANFALQAHLDGWSTRAMGGFDRDAAPSVLHVPDGYTVEIAMAVGRPGPVDALPDNLQGREVPNGRRPIGEFIHNGTFP